MDSPKKRSAYNRVRYAKANGKIVAPPGCSKCGKATKLNGHHEDYDEPLDVKWLCPKCHREVHNPRRTFLEPVARRLRENGFTQADIARILDVAPSTAWKWTR